MLKLKILCCLIVLSYSFWLKACAPTERLAYDTIVGAKAFLDSEKKAHPECVPISIQPGQSISGASTICVNLARGTAAKDILIDATEVYCSGPQFESGGACQPPKKGTPGYVQAQAKLQAAIANYSQIEKDLKGMHQ